MTNTNGTWPPSNSENSNGEQPDRFAPQSGQSPATPPGVPEPPDQAQEQAQGWGSTPYPPGYGSLPQYPQASSQPQANEYQNPNQFGQAPQYGQWPQGPNFGSYAPPPPVIPFRPLNLGDLFQGTFAAIRSNPKVMFTFSIVTMLIVGVIGGVINAGLFRSFQSWTESWTSSTFGSDWDSSLYGPVSLSAGMLQTVVSVLQAGTAVLLTGMLVLSVTNSVVGTNRDLKGTWEQLKPKFWRLVGTTILVSLIVFAVVFVGTLLSFFAVGIGIAAGNQNSAPIVVILLILLILAVIGLAVWLVVRLYFATMCTVVEDVSPGTAIARSWALTRGSFWRVLGRLLIMGLVVGTASSIIGGIVTTFGMAIMSFSSMAAVSALLITVLLSLVTGLVQPVSAAFGALMYVDQRIRNEGLAPRLQEALDANRG